MERNTKRDQHKCHHFSNIKDESVSAEGKLATQFTGIDSYFDDRCESLKIFVERKSSIRYSVILYFV